MSKKEPSKSPNREKQSPPVSASSEEAREESSTWSIVKEQRIKFEENQRKLKELIDGSRFQNDDKMSCQSLRQPSTSSPKLQTPSKLDSFQIE